MKTYTIERVTALKEIGGDLALFLVEQAPRIAGVFGNKFDPEHFDYGHYCHQGLFWICRRERKPVGVLLARLYPSVFDHEVRILMQDLLYVSEPGSRASWLLMNEFIDFGKSNADHLITMLTPKTNIKRRSLEKLGFSKLEELYRLEC